MGIGAVGEGSDCEDTGSHLQVAYNYISCRPIEPQFGRPMLLAMTCVHH